mmetsp:Transcript_2318/g.3288  ORF Transcript_2318/g.3288 Transcript_2318/m.3288 type:complete len:190 (+) Transcript_2318:73-642(+)|eukprot:CAMPEP_0171462452 /NCGR_PEP_ID=MMETSP0945-20130129/6484_1 /TAXON_ID=109269 /ORGANISM="Vaucheria litorea, Strain CCMP2940" /LENGTH=189 /DNA_ID=CAMNT_0011988981 /DNA_START=66 /DNA_END=635 /DNA_ORIENTATION=-
MASKIVKPQGKEADEFELKVAEEIQKLEGTPELKADLEGLYILGAKEVSTSGGKKAVILMIPYKLLTKFRKVQVRLVRELEKKLQGRHVLVIAHRTIYGDSFNRDVKTKGVKPRSRTLTAVHEAILDDIVYPTEIVGKRTRYRLDGTKQLKVYLHTRDLTTAETKLDTFAAVYKKLTSKDVVFEFPVES